VEFVIVRPVRPCLFLCERHITDRAVQKKNSVRNVFILSEIISAKGAGFFEEDGLSKRHSHYADYRLSYRCTQSLAKGTAIMHMLH
jgi:hypothetical protein